MSRVVFIHAEGHRCLNMTPPRRPAKPPGNSPRMVYCCGHRPTNGRVVSTRTPTSRQLLTPYVEGARPTPHNRHRDPRAGHLRVSLFWASPCSAASVCARNGDRRSLVKRAAHAFRRRRAVSETVAQASVTEAVRSRCISRRPGTHRADVDADPGTTEGVCAATGSPAPLPLAPTPYVWWHIDRPHPSGTT